jgi:tRNA pseudouridine55 synthase
VLIDKPGGLTSHDVVARIRRGAGTRKVGHAGTLDPMATGLLILGVNSSTRLLTYVVGLDKEYLATIRLGASTATDDAEGETVTTADPSVVQALTEPIIVAATAPFHGRISQRPSSVSAIKVNGKRAYAMVRAGETPELVERPVTISAYDVLAVTSATTDDGAPVVDVTVRVECSSGTYIRALARDLGEALQTGGHLTSLRRTRIGPFSVSDASLLDDLDVHSVLRAPSAVARDLFGVVELTDAQTVDLGNGKRVAVDHIDSAGPLAAIASDDRLVGLVSVSSGRAKTLINFPADDVQDGGSQ